MAYAKLACRLRPVLGPLTADHPAPGLTVYQPARGFRYAMDPFLLGGWALEGGAPASFRDVGTGSGVLALLLARLGIPGEGIDVRGEWLALAARSAAESGLDIGFRHLDARALDGPAVELALCNPPYYPRGAGHLPPDPLKAAARHEQHGSLVEIIAAMARTAERVALVLRPDRLAEAEVALAASGRPVARRCLAGDRLALVEGRASGGTIEDRRVALIEAGEWSGAVRGWYARLGATLPPRRADSPQTG